MFYALAILLAVIGAAFAFFWTNPSRLALLSDLASESGVTVDRDISYGPLPRQKLDVYWTSDRKAPGPIALFIYGGSWRQGDKNFYSFVGTALAKRGITTVIPDYRIFPDALFPAFMVDAALAYGWTARVPAATCTPSRPIYLVGQSAGAHMAALLVTDTSYLDQAAPGLPKPAGLVGLAGPYTFQPVTWETTKEIFETTAEHPDKPRPIAFVGSHVPPTLLMHGKADTLVNIKNMREFAAALKAAGVLIKTHELNGIGHLGIILAIAKPFRWRAPVLRMMTAFINSGVKNDAVCQ